MVQDLQMKLEFQPFDKDLQIVEQVGFVDLRRAYEDASVPSDLGVDESTYNGIDDPSSIIGRPDDVFAAHRAGEAYKAAQSAKEAKAKSGDKPDTGSASSSVSPTGAQDA